MARLSKQLMDNGQYKELARAAKDRAYCYEKMVEYKIVSEEEAKQLLSISIRLGRLSVEKETVAAGKHLLERLEE